MNDFSVISFTAYDQFNNTLPYANFTLACNDSPSKICVFSLSEDGEPVTQVMTNENGTLDVYFSSIQAGRKCVRIFDSERVQAKAFPITVTPIINCPEFTISMSNITDPASSLIIGLDNPILNASVVDLNNDPIDGANVTFEMIYQPGRKRTPAAFVATTNVTGIATYDVGLLGQGGGTVSMDSDYRYLPRLEVRSDDLVLQRQLFSKFI